MGKTTQIILLLIGTALILFNLFTVDYQAPWSSSSQISWIGVVAGICAVVIVLLNRASQKVDKKLRSARRKTGQSTSPEDSSPDTRTQNES